MDSDVILDGGQQTVQQLRQRRENQSIIWENKTIWTGHCSLETLGDVRGKSIDGVGGHGSHLPQINHMINDVGIVSLLGEKKYMSWEL